MPARDDDAVLLEKMAAGAIGSTVRVSLPFSTCTVFFSFELKFGSAILR